MADSKYFQVRGALLALSGAASIGGIFFFGDYDYWRWQLIAVLGGVSFLALFTTTHWPILKFWFLGICLFLGTAISTCFALGSFDFYKLYELIQWSLFLVLSPIFGLWLKKFGLSRVLLSVLLFALPVYGLFNIPYYLIWLLFEGGEIAQLLPIGFANIRLWSHLATWLLPLAPIGGLLLISRRSSKAVKLIYLFGVGCWWMLIFITTSRGSLVSIAFALFFLAVVFKSGFFRSDYFRCLARQFTVGMFLWLFLCVLLPILILPEGDAIQRELKLHSSGRIGLFHEALSMSLVNFPLGMGPLAWLTHEPLVTDSALVDAVGSPHNMILLVAAEFGWISVIGMGLAFGWLFTSLARLASFNRYSSGDKNLVIGVVISVVAAVVHSQFSGIFMTGASLLVGFAVLSIAFSLIFEEKRLGVQYLDSGRRGYTAAIRLAVIVLSLSLLASSWSYYQLMLNDREQMAEQGNFERKPRVWFHGDYPK